jgi:translocation and assembly module TamA
MSLRAVRACLAALAVASVVPALAADEAEPAKQVAETTPGLAYRVEIEAPEPLKRVLAKSLDLVRWEGYANMTPLLLGRLAAEARVQAEQAAQTEGYFSAVATSAVEQSGDSAVVRIRVEPGPPTIVRSVDIRVTGPIEGDPDHQAVLKRIVADWRLREGERFTQSAWDAAKRRAVADLSEKRFAAAIIEKSEARIDPETRSATLFVELASGPPFRYGAIEARGFSRYSPEIAEKVSPIKPGELYDDDMLALYQRRLLDTGYFATVQVGIDPDVAQAGNAPVRVTVVEARPRRVEAGVGYSTDTGYRATADYADYDFFGTSWRWRNELRYEQKIQSIATSFDSPPLEGGAWNSITAKALREDIQNQIVKQAAVGVSHNWGWERQWPSYLSLSYHREDSEVEDVTTRTRALFLGYRLIHRSTDDFLNPRRGVLASFELGGAPPAVSTQAFVRGRVRATGLVPISRDGDLTLRAELGVVLASSSEGVPPTFLFRTGGDTTVRGYAFESLGVKDGDAVVGGRYLAVASIEYTHWIAESWGLAAFVDAGNAADTLSGLKPAYGVGVGARARTPIGPLRFDVAYGEETNSVRIHFSFGYTF